MLNEAHMLICHFHAHLPGLRGAFWNAIPVTSAFPHSLELTLRERGDFTFYGLIKFIWFNAVSNTGFGAHVLGFDLDWNRRVAQMWVFCAQRRSPPPLPLIFTLSVRNSDISSARSTGIFYLWTVYFVLLAHLHQKTGYIPLVPLVGELTLACLFFLLGLWTLVIVKRDAEERCLTIVSHCYADPTVTFLSEHKRVSNWVSAFKAAILACVSEDSSEDCVLHCVSLCIIIFWMFYSLLPSCSESCLSYSVDLIIFSPQRSAVLYCAYLTSSTWLFWFSLLTGSSRS